MNLQDNRATLRTRTLADLLALQLPQREVMLDPWLHQRHLNMTYAPAGVGKSLFTMSVALAVAGGGSFLGWKAPKARRVLLVDAEMDVQDLQERSATLLPTAAGVDAKAAGENLRLLAQQDQAVGVKFPDLADEAGRNEILAQVAKHRAELVILDNFSTLATVEDENSASSFDPVLNLMRDLKQAGAACILVHHSRKGNSGDGSYRGTSKMAVVFNSVLALSHPGGIPSTTGAAFELKWEKYRGLRDESMRPLKVQLSVSRDGIRKWTGGVSEDAQLVETVAAVRSLDYCNYATLAAKLGITKGALSKRKVRAVAGRLIREREWNNCIALARQQGQPEPATEF